MKNPKALKTSLWVGSTYFIEGLPYIIVRVISSVFFTDMGVRETYLGFLNFLGIPWNFKFLWAPFVDIFSTKRSWMIKIQIAITVLIFAIAVLAGFVSKEAPDVQMLQMIAFLFVGLAFLATVNDISIDGYYLEGLTTKEDQAAYAGFRVMTYRLAVIYARTVFVAVAAVANWFYGFGIGAATMLLFLILHKFFLPKFELQRDSKISVSQVYANYKEAFSTYLKQDRIVLVLLFIITYKLGDELMFSMNTAFLMRELGVTKLQISWLAGIIGMITAIAGTMTGAWWVRKVGLKKAIWPITLIMNINIWVYVVLAWLKPSAATQNGITWIAIAHGYEQIAAGLGNATLAIFLMRLCKKEYKAAHFAFGSAIMSVGANFLGGFGGVIVEHIGYVNLYMISFFASFPAMILLFFVPMHEEK